VTGGRKKKGESRVISLTPRKRKKRKKVGEAVPYPSIILGEGGKKGRTYLPKKVNNLVPFAWKKRKGEKKKGGGEGEISLDWRTLKKRKSERQSI